MKGSDTPEADLRIFFKAQLVFWLLGATDGHAKNFSVRLSARGRFKLAPLYDVLSAQPNFDAGEIRKNKMKIAMAVGKNRHYAVDSIAPRHFAETAELCRYPAQSLDEIIAELRDTARPLIDDTIAQLNGNFPQSVAQSIAGAAKRRVEMLRAS